MVWAYRVPIVVTRVNASKICNIGLFSLENKCAGMPIYIELVHKKDIIKSNGSISHIIILILSPQQVKYMLCKWEIAKNEEKRIGKGQTVKF